ncbi:MAG: ribbon-helix-helix domain-containing protein [Actinobacteria bacterium]|nr:ribbon-helix-helix domain-containing protein [Actinomycetota bacterium]
MSTKLKNITFSLPEDLMKKFKEYAKKNYVASVSSAVREALEQYSRKIEKERLYEQMREASKDPLFMKDLNESMDAFKSSDNEASRRITEW